MNTEFKKSTGKMEDVNTEKPDSGDKQRTNPRSAYHHYILSSLLPEAEQEYLCMKKEYRGLKTENIILKKKIEALMTEAEQFKAERQRVQDMGVNIEQRKKEFTHSKNQLVVFGRKVDMLETDLRRRNKENRDLKEELEATKKKLQSVKQDAENQKAKQLNLKERLDQVIKERDGLSDKWQCYKNECSELRSKITRQQSSLNIKDSKCNEQMKQIHLLKLERERLEKEVGIKENHAEHQRRELKKYEDELHESRLRLNMEHKLGRRICINKNGPPPSPTRKPSLQVPHQKIESLQKNLREQTEERRKAQKQCEELKGKLTQMSEQFQQCQKTVKHQKENLMALTAERNMYKSETKKLRTELADVKKVQESEKQQNKTVKKTRKIKESSGEKSSQIQPPAVSSRLPPRSRDKLKSIPPPQTSTEVQVRSELRIIGTKI